MELNKILHADILDIIFEGRNKEYGAYELRKTYDKRLRNALLGTAPLCHFTIRIFCEQQNGSKKQAIWLPIFYLINIKRKWNSFPPVQTRRKPTGTGKTHKICHRKDKDVKPRITT